MHKPVRVKPTYHFAVRPVVVTTETVEVVEVRGLRIIIHRTTRIAAVVLYHGNIVRPVFAVLLGKHHNVWFRMATGVAIAVVGLFTAKYFGHSHNEFVAYAGDGVGYGLHAVGCTPFIDKAIEHYEQM